MFSNIVSGHDKFGWIYLRVAVTNHDNFIFVLVLVVCFTRLVFLLSMDQIY